MSTRRSLLAWLSGLALTVGVLTAPLASLPRGSASAGVVQVATSPTQETAPQAEAAYAGWTADDWVRFRWLIDPAWRLQVVAYAIGAYPGGCGGDLPPCFVLDRESGGDPRVWNGGCYAPVGWAGTSPCGTSSASGRWQHLRATWQASALPEVAVQFLNAADAPVYWQDDTARRMSCGHWSC